jgi:hypothetical protein
MDNEETKAVGHVSSREGDRRALAARQEALIRQLEEESLEAQKESARLSAEAMKPRGILGWLGITTSVG